MKPEVGHLLHDFIPEADVYVVAQSIKRLFGNNGNRKNRNAARLRFLWREIGEAAFRSLYEAEVAALRAENPAPFAPAVHPDAPAAPGIAPSAVESPAFADWKRRFVEAQRQPGLVSVVVPASLGNLATDDAIRLADFLEPLGPDVVRASFGQNLRLRNIPEQLLGNLWEIVRYFDPLAAQPRALANAVVCAGADTCKLGICRSKGALAAIAGEWTRAGIALDAIPGFQLNISGCPNTCGQHMLADLGFFGNAGRKNQKMYPAYAVVAGARIDAGEARFAKAFGRISARALPNFATDVVRLWLDKRDRFASFADYVDGEGAADIEAALRRHGEEPDFEDDKNYYYDWGADQVFSLVGYGAGECSAGLFDLIDVDLKEASRLREALAAGDGDEAFLYQLALRTARALLITRGIEADSDRAVFAAFSRHFIAAGLIPSRFQPALTAAQYANPPALLGHRDDLFALLDEVKNLYRSMDNSLRFPAERTKPAETPAPQAAALERDYRAVGCPLNFVMVKFDLEKLAAGQTLRVILGDGDPIRNVPLSVGREGHRILRQERLGSVWEVLIEKAG